MSYYKLTNQKMQTFRGFQWTLGKWVKTDGKHKRLCNNSWLHCYSHPLLAVLFNPIHATIVNPRMFRVNVRGKKLSGGGTKFGFTQMRLVEEISPPEITTNQRIAFGILCVKQIYKDKKWNEWADNWLSGKDRSYGTANVTLAAINTDYAAAVTVATDAADVTFAAADAVDATANDPYPYATSAAANCRINNRRLIALAKQALYKP